MKFVLKDYDDLKISTEKMSNRELLKLVSCPQVSADQLDFPRGYQMLYLHGADKQSAKRFVDEYNKGREQPVMICADTECGAGDMIRGCTAFPSINAFGYIGDENLAYELGLIAARDSINVGYRWSFSPVVDVYDGDSEEYSTRCAGTDPDTIIKICGAYMRGMHDGGLASSIKHFPGAGHTKGDSHLSYGINPLSAEEWDQTDGAVYRALIEQGAMCVMPGHEALPAFDTPDAETGLCPPATLSYNLLTKLLKEKLGFEGIICSDAVTMSGFSGYMNYYKGCARYLESGGDILLFARTDERFFDEMERMIAEGYLSRKTLLDRAYRVSCFARQIMTEMNSRVQPSLPDEYVVEQSVQRSIQIERDRNAVIPFQATKKSKILVTDFSNVYWDRTDAEDFYNEIHAHYPNAEFWQNPGPEKLARAADLKEFDLIICTIANHTSFGTNVLRPHGILARNLMEGWTKYDTPVIFISFHMPNFCKQFPLFADTVIYTHGVAEPTHRALRETIFTSR